MLLNVTALFATPSTNDEKRYPFCAAARATARTAGNLGFDTYVVGDACATTNRIGPDGVDHEPELIHQLSLASLHGEFCTVLRTADALALLTADAAGRHAAVHGG